MLRYLKTDPQYSPIFKNVWMWGDFPARKDFGGTDTGIDLVALTHEGDYWAIQCKCWEESSYLDKPAVDSFLATSSRTFLDPQLQKTKFSHRLWISTTDRWTSNAEEAIRNQSPPLTRIDLTQLKNAPVDWDKIASGTYGEAARNDRKTLRPHQQEAMDKAHAYYKNSDRGKLIMACGTGKTFTSLRIAENLTGGKGLILFFAPSIALIGQTLREWTADAKEPINAICICSDPEISRQKKKDDDTGDFSIVDLALPASTKPDHIIHQFYRYRDSKRKGMTVVFSTYQSIDVIAKAQKDLLRHDFPEFDLIICDEAHRTTGVTLKEANESEFVKVHDNKFIRAKKRLYMTATPRLYSEDAKNKAAQYDAELCSMDDEKVYGEEIYRIGFGNAVEQDLLSDYKVLILTLNENDIPPALQNALSGEDEEISTDDASKLIGCINALSKQIIGDEGSIKETDPDMMKRAVAFCPRIVDSKGITSAFNTFGDEYIKSLESIEANQRVTVSSKHIDGTMNAPERDSLLSWLKDTPAEKECRVLTNVRCLSEGVDVPSLDAVLFLSPRNSQIDVVQSVGRVMRKAPGKKYGYIIIPVVIPSNVNANEALDDNERFKVVWTVLNALRAHDDRFNATVNKLELNKKKPKNIIVGKVPHSTNIGQSDGKTPSSTETIDDTANPLADQLSLQFEELQGVIFGRMVKKVGDRRYLELWAKQVALIAENQIAKITALVEQKGEHKKAFDEFLAGLKKNINPSISPAEAIEMLSQHIITEPIFEALFEGYSFVKNNAVSISMQEMLDLLKKAGLWKDTQELQRFYDDVKRNIGQLDNAAAKQTVIVRLYNNFFKIAFPKMVERLGIVYTPVEVVDFIIHSVDDMLKKEFGRSLTDENVNIFDPFTGTGTFITRLIQSGLIKNEDLPRKYKNEIFANEIVLLAYYIAAVNIENAYHDVVGGKQYKSFDGICLTDTFQLGEAEDGKALFSEIFKQNSERVERQRETSITVIMGNPPYSVGQTSANDNAKNETYPKLESRIAETYAANTEATNKNSLYNSYIKAFRWSTDRLDPKNGGVIGFVCSCGWLNGNAAKGIRKCFENDFSTIYIFNLRGNCNGRGEVRKKEAGNIFGEGSKDPISIVIFIKNPSKVNSKAILYYYDIGDYLSREDKLKIIDKYFSISNIAWEIPIPNKHNDWINQRNDIFSTYIPLGDKDNKSSSTFFLPFYSNGLKTQHDPWCTNSSINSLANNIKSSITYYNAIAREYIEKNKNESYNLNIQLRKNQINYSDGLKQNSQKGRLLKFQEDNISENMYRPFFKQVFYYDNVLNERVYQIPKSFPTPNFKNITICVSGNGENNIFSSFIVNCIPDVQLLFNCQCFPLYYYEEQKDKTHSLFDENKEYTRRDGISDFILNRAQTQYGKNVTKEDIFYYVYGFLHSPDYRVKFANDLKKMLPRLPLVDSPKNFWSFSKAGRNLAELHLNYETIPPLPKVKVSGAESKQYKIEKMKFPAKDRKDTIIYNSKIIIENIPAKAYEYIVNGKSAIEWVMERYQVKTDKESGIKNDPNDWAKEHKKPRYILDLLLSVITVSIKTADIVDSLPKVDF
jgi:predicted helicase